MCMDKVVITIADKTTPIIVLLGSPTSGKNLMLVRMTKYLEQLGYNVFPDGSFRSQDLSYQRDCQDFHKMIYSRDFGGKSWRFMLLKVINGEGHSVCQFLKFPGSLFYDHSSPEHSFPRFINNVCMLQNRKTWMFIVEENWGSSQMERDFYAKKIMDMRNMFSKQDKVIFVCNKVDRSEFILSNGHPDKNKIFRKIQSQYPHIFDKYINSNSIIRLFSPYKFDFVPFSAGVFHISHDGRDVFIPSNDFYPKQLWQSIKSSIH